METFGSRFKALRGKLSQTQFAEYLGIEQANISRYEADKSLPETKILLTIQEKLNVSLDWLLKGIGQKDFVSHSGTTDIQMKQAALEVIDSVREQFLNNYSADSKGKRKKNRIQTLNKYAIGKLGYSLN